MGNRLIAAFSFLTITQILRGKKLVWAEHFAAVLSERHQPQEIRTTTKWAIS